MLTGPLSKDAGGRGICWKTDDAGNRVPANVFTSTDDPDYQVILTAANRARHYITREVSHFSVQPFYPNPWYAREMIRYGILPPDYDCTATPIDPFETDRKYYESLWPKFSTADTVEK